MIQIIGQNSALLPNPVFKEIVPPYIVLKYTPTNRQEKRIFDRECDKVMQHLLPVEFGFIATLFDEAVDEPYTYIFNRFNEDYKKAAQWLKLTAKLKMIAVDEAYFFNEFNTLNTTK